MASGNSDKASALGEKHSKNESSPPCDSVLTRQQINLQDLQTHSAIIVTDKDRYIEWVNSSFTRITGFALEEVVGKKPSLLQGPNTDLRSILSMRKQLDTGKCFVEEIVNYRKAGEPYWAHLEVCPLLSEHGDVKGYLGLHSDITQMKRDHQVLSNFRTAVEESPSTIVITDLNGIIRYVNPAFERTTGYTAGEAIGQHTRMLKSGYQNAEYYEAMWHSLREKKHWEGVFQNKRKDGSLYWEYATLSEMKNDAGEPTGYIAIKQDITRQKLSEQELVRVNRELNHTTQYAEQMARKAQDASEAKSNYLAEMSHEIRTPMSGILGLADLLADTELSPEQREYLNGIRTSGEGLLALINNILDLSKIEAGRFELIENDFYLQEVVEGVVDSLRANALSKKLDLQLDCKNKIAVNVRGDARCLRQVLMNLVGNAIKFTDEGCVSIVVEITGCSSRGYQCYFGVRDTGMGIALADQKKLFQKYVQVNFNNGHHPGGTGLGLALAQEMVERMGGKMGVRSPLKEDCEAPAAGAGSEFWFIMNLAHADSVSTTEVDPVGKKPSANKSRVKHLTTGKKMKKLLVVEDNATNRLVAELMIKKLGYPVHSVGNGKEALDAVEQECYDLVLMDIQMPVMDGLEATRRVRESDGMATPRTVPIVAMTAHAMSRDRDKCLCAGMDGFLPKPVSREQLAATLEQLLG
jgi:two-component system, sensor histidine kinase and response regulator